MHATLPARHIISNEHVRRYQLKSWSQQNYLTLTQTLHNSRYVVKKKMGHIIISVDKQICSDTYVFWNELANSENDVHTEITELN